MDYGPTRAGECRSTPTTNRQRRNFESSTRCDAHGRVAAQWGRPTRPSDGHHRRRSRGGAEGRDEPTTGGRGTTNGKAAGTRSCRRAGASEDGVREPTSARGAENTGHPAGALPTTRIPTSPAVTAGLGLLPIGWCRGGARAAATHASRAGRSTTGSRRRTINAINAHGGRSYGSRRCVHRGVQNAGAPTSQWDVEMDTLRRSATR